MSNNPLEDFTPIGEEYSVEQILNFMLDPESIDMKTEINNVSAFTGIHVIAGYFRDLDMNLTADVIENYLETYKRLKVSEKRRGRTEIIEALKGLIEHNPMMKEKLMGDVG